VQFETTLGALAQRLGNRRQNRAALRAARHRVRAGHLDSARPKGVLARSWPVLRLPLLLLRAAVLISVLAVFTI
jgi:hypothetical protein